MCDEHVGWLQREREQDIYVKTIIPSQNTTFRCNPALKWRLEMAVAYVKRWVIF